MSPAEACDALKEKKCVELKYSGKIRTVEIHAVGFTKDNHAIMRVWQVHGGSVGGNPSNWRLLRLDEVEGFRVLDDESRAPRPGYKRGDSTMYRISCQI